MDKKSCSHKQKKDIIDNLFENKDKVVIDILPTLPTLPVLPTLPILPDIRRPEVKLSYSTKLEPIKIEEIKAESVKAESVKAESVKAESVKAESVKGEPIKVETVKQEEQKTDNTLMINQNREQFINLSIEEIHLNFKTLSRIKEHDKMYLRDCKFLEIDDSYLQMVSRTVKNVVWNGYNREDIIDFLLHLTEQTMKACDTLINTLKCSYEGKENTKNVLTNLLIDMEQSLIGLQKIKITYYNDNAILTRLDMIIDKFDKKIREVRDFLLKNN